MIYGGGVVSPLKSVFFSACVTDQSLDICGNNDISPPIFLISYMPPSFESKQFGYINGISVLFYIYNFEVFLNISYSSYMYSL